MKSIFTFHPEVNCYFKQLDNGLKIYLIPNPKRSEVLAHIYYKIGGMTNGYIKNNQFHEIPTGVAHFLEHQLFNQPDGTDIFAFFDKNGAYANAATGSENTYYYFKTPMNFEENFQMLLDYVNEPYFKKKSVLKERKIIIEEYKMGKDSPFTRIFEKLMKQLFHVNPVKNAIIGTKQDIKRTTSENLYEVYETFYQPSNSMIIISGNFDNNVALQMIEKKYKNKSSNDFTLPIFEEPLEVVQSKSIIRGQGEVTRFAYAFKIKITPNDKFIQELSLELLRKILFGKTSEWCEMNKRTNLVRNFSTEVWLVKDFIVFFAFGETNQYLKTIHKFEKLFKSLEIAPVEFERAKKVFIASSYAITESNDNLSDTVQYMIDKYGEIIDQVEVLKKLDYQKFMTILKSFNFDHTTYVVEKPKNKV